MSGGAATFYCLPPTENPDDPIVVHCTECDSDLSILDLDKHAGTVHKAVMLRTFQTKSGYDDWVSEQKLLARVKEEKNARSGD